MTTDNLYLALTCPNHTINQPVRRVCDLHFDFSRAAFVEQIPKLYSTFIELPMFDELEVRLVDWASKEKLGDIQPKVKELEEKKKQTDTWIELLTGKV